MKRTLGGPLRSPASSDVRPPPPSLARVILFFVTSPVPISALAEVGFAHRSQSAGGFGNPPRVPIIIEERVGVEPTLPFGKPDFESGAFGHSAISPFVISAACEALVVLQFGDRQPPGGRQMYAASTDTRSSSEYLPSAGQHATRLSIATLPLGKGSPDRQFRAWPRTAW